MEKLLKWNQGQAGTNPSNFFMSVRQAAKANGLTRQRVNQLINDGQIFGIQKIDSFYLVPINWRYQRKRAPKDVP